MRRNSKTGQVVGETVKMFCLRLGKLVLSLHLKEFVSKMSLSKLDSAWMIVELDKT
jgi:hypothetical protein